LEKTPLDQPEEFIPPMVFDPNNILTEEEEKSLQKIMIGLADYSTKHRVVLKKHFQDKVGIF